MTKSKKSISRFLNSEEGKILNSDIVKLGVTLGVIGAAVAETETIAVAATNQHRNFFQHSQRTHSNKSGLSLHIFGSWHINITQNFTPLANSHYSHVAHNSHGSHSSHGSHGSHGSHARGGWC